MKKLDLPDASGDDAPSTFGDVIAYLEKQAEAQLEEARAKESDAQTALIHAAEAAQEYYDYVGQIHAFRSHEAALADGDMLSEDDILEAFGRRLRFLREVVLDTTRERFSSMLGVSVPTIQNWEAGRKRITDTNLHIVAKTVGVAPEVLWPANWFPNEGKPARRADKSSAIRRTPVATQESTPDLLRLVEGIATRLESIENRLGEIEGGQGVADADDRPAADTSAAARAGARAARAGRQQSESTPAPSQPRRRAQS